jgi:hypothetical protein
MAAPAQCTSPYLGAHASTQFPVDSCKNGTKGQPNQQKNCKEQEHKTLIKFHSIKKLQ